MSALQALERAKAQADARQNMSRYIEARRLAGWTDSDIAEYCEAIGVLMSDDAAAALSLFSAGLYKTAEEARADAMAFWASSTC